MPLNAPSAPSRTILLQVSQAPTPTFPFRIGAAFYHKPNSRLISSAPLASTPSCRPMHNSRAHSTSHAHHSHPQGRVSSFMKNPPSAKLGPHMVPTGGTLAQPSTITNAIASGSHAPMPNASSTPFPSSPKPSPYPTLPIKTLRYRLLENSPMPYNNRVFVDPSHSFTTTISRHSVNSAKSSPPSLRGWNS